MGTEDAIWYCLSCLSQEDKQTQPYTIQSDALKAVLQVDKVNLCIVCKNVAQRSEQFIQNVQSHQIYLKNTARVSDSTIDTGQDVDSLNNLSHISMKSIVLTNDTADLDKPIFEGQSSCPDNDIYKVKLEMKQELPLENLDEDFLEDYQESSIKAEECSLKELKEESGQIDFDDVSLKQLIVEEKRKKKSSKKVKLKKIPKSKHIKQARHKNEIRGGAITIVRLTKEEVVRERSRMREELNDKNFHFKCDDCILGFNFKESYEKHIERHSEDMGPYKCNICNKRTNAMEKLISHKKYHQIRYKCCECGLTYVNRKSANEHLVVAHGSPAVDYTCPHCDKVFKRKGSLNRHIAYIKRSDQNINCMLCSKTLSSKEGLKNHIMQKHPNEVPGHKFQQHFCKECGAGFKNPSQLRNHMVKHSDKKDFYCVECDRGFKTKFAMTQHLKVTSAHVNYLELKLQCDECDKRFGVKRDLERHMNRVHLNRKPFQCDQCDRAYVNLWSLTDHKRYSHEGKKRPLKHPCPICDKVFALKYTLKVHMYTHTGERPYACPKCDARFNQPGIRATHVRLVHMRLGRDSRPKKQGV